MGANGFNEMELDAIGEIMNISLGASATAVSTMLGTKVNITTPVVRVQSRNEFEFKRLEPAIGVEISYVEGLEGKNIMMFRQEDVRIIVGTMMGGEVPEEMMSDEITISAICEVMNQMMGASATALSEFLGTIVNISTPISFEIGEPEDFKDKYFTDEEGMVIVRFNLEIEDKLSSEFMNMMPPGLAKRLLAPFEDSFAAAAAEEPAVSEPAISETAPEPAAEGSSDRVLTPDEIAAMVAGASGDTSASALEPAAGGSSDRVLTPDEIAAMVAGASGDTPASAPEPAAAEGSSDRVLTPDEIAAMVAGASGPAPAKEEPVAEAQPAAGMPGTAATAGQVQGMPVQAAQPMGAVPGQAPMPQAGQPYYAYPPMGMDPMMLQLLNQMQQTQMQMMEMMKNSSKAPEQPSNAGSGSIIRPLVSPQIQDDAGEGEEDKANQEMLMKVPLEISVEIGRTKRLVRDILEFTQGTLVVLDKMAGEQVDLFVNGQCIARGDIVVVEDNFGIRITEIVSRELPAGIL